MRHKFATDLLERGANIKVVQELLGHENLATTEVYLSIVNQSLHDAVRLLDDREEKPSCKRPQSKSVVEKTAHVSQKVGGNFVHFGERKIYSGQNKVTDGNQRAKSCDIARRFD